MECFSAKRSIFSILSLYSPSKQNLTYYSSFRMGSLVLQEEKTSQESAKSAFPHKGNSQIV